MTLTDMVGTRSVLTFRSDTEVVPVRIERTNGGVQGVAEEAGEPGRAGLGVAEHKNRCLGILNFVSHLFIVSYNQTRYSPAYL